MLRRMRVWTLTLGATVLLAVGGCSPAWMPAATWALLDRVLLALEVYFQAVSVPV